MTKKSNTTIQLGDLIAAACDRASRTEIHPRDVSFRAAVATAKTLLSSGNVRAFARLVASDRKLA